MNGSRAPVGAETRPRAAVRGRTFSLRAGRTSSDHYFDAVATLADACLAHWRDAEAVLVELRLATRNRRRLTRLARRAPSEDVAAFVLDRSRELLDPFLEDVEAHRAALSLLDRRGATLGATREQYLLFMVEIEVANRVARSAFAQCAARIALLPHCLHDLEVSCQAIQHGPDNVCVACSPRCEINAVSTLLRRSGIRPYIWMTADLKRLVRDLARSSGSVGVLGIACIPELVHGMRRCNALGTPSLGLPLDANRCMRWFGEFRRTGVNLDRLAALVG